MSFLVNPFQFAVAAPAQAWNPADLTNVTLTNSNRTATGTGTGGVRAITGHSSGKWHFEMTVVTLSGTTPNIGIAKSTAVLGTSSNTNANVVSSFGVTPYSVYNQASLVLSAADNIVNGTIMAVEADLDGGLIYFQIQGGTRYSSGSIAGMTGLLYPWIRVLSTTVATLNTGQAAFVITPTSGYSAWG